MGPANLAAELPLLAGLPKVELAKLMAEIEVQTYPGGTTIDVRNGPAEWLYFVLRGDIELTYGAENLSLPLMVLGSGSTFGEDGPAPFGSGKQTVRTVTEVILCKVPLRKFQALLEKEPTLARNYNALLNSKFHGSMQELLRTKQMLAAYVEEVWNSTPPLPEEVSAAAVHAAAPLEALQPVHRQEAKRRSFPRLSSASLGLLLGTLASIFTYLAADRSYAAVSAIFVWAAVNWLLGSMPDYAVALAASTMLVLTGVVKPDVAFSGFASSGWFLLLGVLGIGVAVSRSGLVYRLALHMLRLLPPSYRGQSFALALTGLLLTPLLPSSNSRAAIGSPLARELSEAMRFPALGRGSAGLAMSSFLGFGQMYFLFLSGGNICMMAWSLMADYTTRPVTWLGWLWFALPLGLITFAGSYLAILLMFPPEPTAGVQPETIVTQLRVLGSMTRNERLTVGVLVVVLAGFLTQSLHGLDPAWLALPGFLLLVALGVIDRNSLKEFDWGFLLLIGALVSLSDVTKVTGLAERLTSFIGPLIQPVTSNPFFFLGAVGLLMLVVRLAIPLQPTVLILVIALLPVATQIGYHPIIIVLVALALSNSWIIPQQNTMYLTVYSGTEERSFTHRQVRGLSLVHAAVGVAAVLGSIPFWRLLGLVPR